ncbi:hypothetical protein QBC45DRAFT_51141 [Copromyces sp. CBS 386.78]|nr:hypothetical protein QBC45DRAFT_51141 [Copromyces sp. CBS 386.78]
MGIGSFLPLHLVFFLVSYSTFNMIPRFRLALSFFLFCIHFMVFFFVFPFCFVHGLGCCSLACFGIHRHWIIIVTVLHLDFFSELGSHFLTYIPNPPTHQRIFLIFFLVFSLSSYVRSCCVLPLNRVGEVPTGESSWS